MSTFDEYAALARHLAAQQRAGEQGAAAAAERQRDLSAAVEYLDRRLVAQGQRLDHLGRTIGIASGGGPTSTAATPGGPLPGGPAPVSGPPGGRPGQPRIGWEPGTGSDGGAAAAPGRPGVGAYSQVGVGESDRALPVAVSATAAGVPAPRAGEADPATELELARRWADEADRHAQQAELLAQQPALLPTWSSRARALAVYAGAAGVGVLLLLILTVGWSLGVVGLGTLLAWMLAGLPAMALIGGWLVLGRWGRPAVGASTPPRHPVLGFLVCFLAVPLAFCGYLLLIRTMR
ncbi:hypothetical protein ACLQ2S_11025 [Micromonospora sp. DT48]|uniref:hypothetical protein n=1 Tax=unclassified Micromonospora TaxID=2617518 RepID=UPI00132C443F|nr:hypothetical protein [Micromonospora sp. CP22]MTK03599.1 hypothetical protein [Micromonospora sp. CP22]